MTSVANCFYYSEISSNSAAALKRSKLCTKIIIIKVFAHKKKSFPPFRVKLQEIALFMEKLHYHLDLLNIISG
jgi:hypothetical protein